MMRTEKLALLAGGFLAACTAEPPIQGGDFAPGSTSSDDAGTDVGQPIAEEGDDAPDDGPDDGPDSSDGGEGEPGEPMCGNDIIDGEDVCDGTALGETSCQSLGFEMGQIGCTPNCGGYDLTNCGFFECGNGKEEGEEDCDGTVGKETCVTQGFDNGTLFCTMDCEYNVERCGICGNRDIDDEEECDTEKELEETCQGLGFMTGSLACGNDCLYDTSGCSTCGNDIQEGAEDCDGPDVPGKSCAEEGFDSGSLACTSDCQYDFTSCGTCGNDLVDGDELCDATDFGGETCVTQGFDSGALTCQGTCDTINTDNCGMCGNDVIDGSESCDGDLLGGQTCAGLGLQGGDLACDATSCQYDFSGCDLQGIPFGDDAFYQGLSLSTAVLPCDEISASGTDLLLGDDDEAVVALPFTFTYYGVNYTDVTIGSNGTLNFGDAFEPGLTNACPIPDAFDTENIAVFWDDLDPPDGNGAGVYHQSFGDRFAVQWDAPHYLGDADDLIRVQATLHANGNIDMCYVDTTTGGNVGDSGAEATAGVQGDATMAVQFSCDTPDLVDGLWLQFLALQ